ncbi:uncharacterized protein PHACADRAFT_148782 [Phanerochaete carnosa HHB-10118-sp]|uniref:peptide-methionine (S)-S-oxide reductase n=1 Tax=Phanerochaete carnosa (strain HHB-10118-sp) TaxID=650164 RepID=K5W053_PHACS|nr:uncharacterized protein PHACADRAFT_148782 [Phanerochaete carnosa HHB-10118-sp]EKM52259.1 hypothetical protein PHACADRAFT_148782 [Phanerochaete carnosa HHB-10118-sp]
MSGAAPEVATFAAGCLWGVEHIFLKCCPISQNKGVLETAVGYTGGRDDAKNPTYRQVCSGTTDHAEALCIEHHQVRRAPEFFCCTHDTTTENSQGADVGTQYRSAIFYHTPEQKEIAERVTAEFQKKHFDRKGEKIVTDIVAAGTWYDDEEYHQEYLHKNPTGYQCPTHRLHR